MPGSECERSCDGFSSSSVGQLLSRNWSSDLCIYFPIFLKKLGQLAKFITQERSHKNPIYQFPWKIQKIRQHPGNNGEPQSVHKSRAVWCPWSPLSTVARVAPAPCPLFMPPAGNCDPYRTDRVPCSSDRKYCRISEERKHFGEHSKVEKNTDFKTRQVLVQILASVSPASLLPQKCTFPPASFAYNKMKNITSLTGLW